MKHLLSDQETADLFGVCRSTVWRWHAAGILPHPIKIAGSTRWKASDLEAVIANAASAA